MSDYSELKRLAEVVNSKPLLSPEESSARVHFQREATARKVLALIAEVDRLAALLECAQGDMRQADKIMARDMKDAERYRWLRRTGFRDVDTDQWSGEDETMDAFIDSDMEEAGNEQA